MPFQSADRQFDHRERFSWLAVSQCFLLVCLLFGAGCPRDTAVQDLSGGMSEEELAALRNLPLRVLCVQPEPWAEELETQYTGQYDSKIEITVEALPTFQQRDAKTYSQFDVLITPPAILPGLALQRQVLELRPENLERMNERSFLQMERPLVRIGKETYGISLGQPLQVMFSHQQPDTNVSPGFAAFQKVIQETGDLVAATSWAHWHTQAVEGNNGQLKYAEPLAEGGAARALLMRGAAYARSRTQITPFFSKSSRQPLINGVPFVEALRELQEEYGAHVQELKDLTSQQAIQHVQQGTLQACIAPVVNLALDDTAEKEADSQSTDSGSEKPQLFVTSIPAASRYFNQFSSEWNQRSQMETYPLTGVEGRVAFVMRQTRKTESALRLLSLIANSPTAESLAPFAQATGPFKEQQLDQLESWFSSEYPAEALQGIRKVYESTKDRHGATSHFPALLGQGQLIEALDRTVLQALETGEDPQQALDRCAAEWEKMLENGDSKIQKQLLNL